VKTRYLSQAIKNDALAVGKMAFQDFQYLFN